MGRGEAEHRCQRIISSIHWRLGRNIPFAWSISISVNSKPRQADPRTAAGRRVYGGNKRGIGVVIAGNPFGYERTCKKLIILSQLRIINLSESVRPKENGEGSGRGILCLQVPVAGQ